MSEKINKKTDRRVEKTKQSLRHAFVELLLKKPYNTITISELTKEADLDRRTFYLHYQCIEDLVMEMQLIARSMITERLKECEDVQLDTLFQCLTAVVRDKMDFYRVIFTEPSCSVFFQDGVNAIKYCLLEANVDSTLSDIQKEYYAEYVANGIMGLYSYWFRQASPSISLEDFADIAKKSMSESIQLIQ